MKKSFVSRKDFGCALPLTWLMALLACVRITAFAQTPPGVTVVELPVPKEGKTGFTPVDSVAAGIKFLEPSVSMKDQPTRHVSNPGLAIGDVDGDGKPDIFFCQLDGTSALFRNLGDWKFEDITESSGLKLKGRSIYGAVLADVNGDGHLDLILTSLTGANSLYLNDGKGHFTEVTDMPWRVTKEGGDVSAALADIDGNGSLDLFVTSYRQVLLKRKMPPDEYNGMVNRELAKISKGELPSKEFLETFEVFTDWNGSRVVYSAEERGIAATLYLNDGKGHFTRVTDADERFFDEDGKPMAMPKDWGLSVAFHDINGDGAPDLYVCNDFLSPDRLWINDGHGRFRLISKLAMRHTSRFSMGVDFADINRDGFVDFFSVDMLSRDHTRRKTQMGDMSPTPIVIGRIDDRPQVMQNTLQLNRGDGTFAEIAMHAGIKASEWSWAPIFVDVDLDGYEDLLVTTGMERDYMDSDTNDKIKKMGVLNTEQYLKTRTLYPELKTHNFIFRNRGDLTFEDMSLPWGFKTEAVSGGMAMADLDGDGDLDVVINVTGGSPQIYRNETVAPRVAVRLQGLAPNTQAIGAKIKLIGGPVTQSQEVICGGTYASGSDPMRVFAAGKSTGGMTLEITWRSGKETIVSEVKPNHLYVINESSAQPTRPAVVETPRPLFVDESHRLNHRHAEEAFDDFIRQPLLPNRLSQLGPGIAWYDVNGDGYEDLIIGSGSGGRLSVFLNDHQGGFKEYQSPKVGMDQSSVLGWRGADGLRKIFIGLSNYESGSTNIPSAQGFQFGGERRWQLDEGLPPQISTTGPMALGDIDGDGVPDLFVGGRVIPGRYPEAASSMLYLSKGGKWVVDEKNRGILSNVGLVSGAVIGDVNGDGELDLVLACEWGPIRVFLNHHGQLKEATQEMGLSEFKGWWNGVTLGDLNGDGKLDIIASNWGRNSKYEGAYSVLNPLRIFYGDFNHDGTMQVVEAHLDKKMGKLVPERGLSCSSRAMPFVRVVTPTFLQFGSSGLDDIYGDKLKSASTVEANTLDNMVFLNRGDKFEAVPMPAEAQLAPGFGVSVGDVDGDGKEDLVMSQNFFAVQIETPRNDAGRGLVLRGTGDGHFIALPGQLSGVKVYGEQRGSALCDYDGDGRVDFVVSQNGAQTMLYHNVGGKPGLRVRLKGPDGNPDALGAVMRLEYGDRKGPTRAVLGGSGYWSEDSLVQVLGKDGEPTALWVRWPGGKEIQYPLTAGAREVIADASGKVQALK